MHATVGPYTLGDSLGMTPFGKLVVATHTARTEPLAVLLLDERLAKDTRFRGLLRLENARAGGLRHPALARVIEIGEASGAMYLVVERLPSCLTLALGMEAGGPLTAADVVGMVRQLAAGVDAAHARRLVHGAIDPTCVLLGDDGGAKLAGIGVLAAAEEAGLGDPVAERQGPAFIAPEQRSGQRIVASADAYALGALADALLRERDESPTPTRAIAAVLERQTSDDPSARYPTCAAFASALAEAAIPAAPAQTVATPAPAPAEPARVVVPPNSPPPSGTLPISPSPIDPPSPTAAPPAPTPESSSQATAPAPADTHREIPPPLPWAPAASLSGRASATPTEPVPPEASSASVLALQPVPARPTDRPPLPQAGELEVWVRDLIDPPQQGTGTPSHQQQPGPATLVGAPRADATWTAAKIQPSRAMLAVPARLEQGDPLGDAVRWATRNAPTVDQMLDRYVTDGKVGPAPLGIAAAGVLTMLLLVLGQFVLATAVVMLVVVLYGVPKLVGMLAAGERKRREQVMRVTGPASLQRRPLGPGWDRYEILLANGVTLSLSQDGYGRLAAHGRPVEVERPAPTGGTMTVAAGHELPSISATYLLQRSLLLDVRDANGTVLARHPRYDGEPGDRLANAPVAPEPVPTWHCSSQSQIVRFPMPPAVRTALAEAKKSALMQVILLIGGPLVLLAATLNTAATGFAIVLAIGLFATLGAARLERLLKLRSATGSDTLTQVTGPVTLERYSTSSASRYQLRVANGDILAASPEAYDALVLLGQLRMSEEPPTTRGEERLTRVHEVEAATVIYEPAGPLLLKMVNPLGETIYRESALGTIEIAVPQPRT